MTTTGKTCTCCLLYISLLDVYSILATIKEYSRRQDARYFPFYILSIAFIASDYSPAKESNIMSWKHLLIAILHALHATPPRQMRRHTPVAF